MILTRGMDTTTNTILTYITLGIGLLTALGTSVSLFLHWLAPRTQSRWDDSAAAKIDELLALLRGLALPPMLSSNSPSVSSAATTATTSPQTPSAKAAQAGRASLSVIAVLALGAAALPGGLAITGCTGLRSTTSTGINAFIDCEAPDVTKLLPDLLPLAQAEVAKWIGGASAQIDTAGLEADLAGMKAAEARCAIAAAIDALAAQSSLSLADPASPVTSREGIATDGDADQLRASFSTVRVGLGWAPLHLANGRVL